MSHREGFTPPYIPPHGLGTVVPRVGGLPYFAFQPIFCRSFFPSTLSSLSNTLWNRFLTNFWLIFRSFFVPKSMPKASLLTFDVVYTQSLISNTPHSVLKDFHFRASFKIQEKSHQNRFRNRFAFDVAFGMAL